MRTRFMVHCVAVGDTGMQTGKEAPGRTSGSSSSTSIDPEEVGDDRRRPGALDARARPAPSGQLPVVLRKGAGGVLFHEACGHGLEADLVDRDASVFRGRVGEQVASPLVTLVDDGAFAREWGTLRDRRRRCARAAQRADRGRRAHRLHVGPRAGTQGRTGQHRQRSPRDVPAPADGAHDEHVLPRGDEDPDDIIAETPYGLYCVALGGGQVNTATGDFVFGMTEAYLIENGRDHRAGARRAAHRQRAETSCAVSTRSATTSTPGPARAARTARASRCRPANRRCGSPSSPSAARRPEPDLCPTCWRSPRVLASAPPRRAGRGYVVAAAETDVKVFDGEVESLTVAERRRRRRAGACRPPSGLRVGGLARRRRDRDASPKRATTPASPSRTSGRASPHRPTSTVWRCPRSTSGARSSRRS